MRLDQTSLLPLLVAVIAVAACGTAVEGPPEIVVDHSACAHCSMLISEPRYAAAYRIDGTDKTFDDIGCLLISLSEEPDGAAAQLWFRDVHDGAWVTPEAATFVHSVGLRTPMAGGIVATAHDAEIKRLVAAGETTVYGTFEEMLAARSVLAGGEAERTGR